jgi:predicted Fe-S protein YdhL (DUF1289 family)
MQLIGTTPLRKLINGLVLQLCVKEGCNRFNEEREDWTRHLLTPDQERDRWVGCYEEHQLADLW